MRKLLLIFLSILSGCICGIIISTKMWLKKIINLEDANQKMQEFYHILNNWLALKQKEEHLKTYFERNEYQTIAIYGMKELGKRLYDELKRTNIEVKYFIDKNAENLYSEVNIITPEQQLEKVDVIVVTAIHYYEEIENMLKEKVDYPIISIEDIIYE